MRTARIFTNYVVEKLFTNGTLSYFEYTWEQVHVIHKLLTD